MPIAGLGIGPFFKQRFHATDIPSLAGKTAVVTGGTAGLGLETTLQLAKAGARVIALSSTEARGQAALKKVKAQLPDAQVEWQHLNLMSVKACVESAEVLKDKVERIDILVACAGVGSGYSVSEDGIEGQFALNHLGHFTFITLLIDLFTGPDCRVVMLSSYSHYEMEEPIGYSSLSTKPNSVSVKFGDTLADANRRYARSKAANVMFANALSRRVATTVFVNSLHPGLIRTDIQDTVDFRSFGRFEWAGKLVLELLCKLGLDVHDGALTQLYAATSPEIKNKAFTGQYFAPIARMDEASAQSRNEAEQEKLWAWSEQKVKEITGRA